MNTQIKNGSIGHKNQKHLMNATEYKTQLKAQLEAIVALGQAIKESKSIPAGHLYAVCSSVMTVDVFDKCIGYLVRAGVVRRSQSHLLEWIGGDK